MKIQNALVSNRFDQSQRYFAHVMTVTLSWRVQNIVVIGHVYFTLECFEFSSNFEFNRNMLSLVLSCLSGHSDPIVLEPFDVTLWYLGVPQMPNLLKISSDIESDFRNGFFNTIAHRFENWIEFIWPLLAKLYENAFYAAIGSRDAWQPPLRWGKLCSGAWKHGQDSHVGMSSLCWVIICFQHD